MKKIVTIVVAGMLLATAGAAFSAEKKIDPKELFETKCGSCHSADRPKSVRRSAQDWEATVMRMKDDHGCDITNAEAKMIIDYLAKHYGAK